MPKTCQDIWHVIHRIDSVMAHNHPGMLIQFLLCYLICTDYYSAKQELSGIFAQLCNSADPNSAKLSTMLNVWLEKYSKAHQDRDEQMQLFIENLAATLRLVKYVRCTLYTNIAIVVQTL